MNTTPLPTTHRNLVVLARVLERLERSTRPVDAEQFRAVALRLAAALESAPGGDVLEAILQGFPAVADIYENLNYRHAGLCRSPLEAALAAEMAARAAIDAARLGATHGPAASQA